MNTFIEINRNLLIIPSKHNIIKTHYRCTFLLISRFHTKMSFLQTSAVHYMYKAETTKTRVICNNNTSVIGLRYIENRVGFSYNANVKYKF